MNTLSVRRIVLSAIGLLTACGSDSGDDAAGTSDPVAQVRTVAVETGASASQVGVYGTAEPGTDGERTVVAPAEAILDRIVAPNGTAVAAGQVIAFLKPSRTTAIALAKAAADAGSAAAAYRRALRLRTDGLDSDGDVETARAADEAARATRANLGIAQDGSALRAPMAGVVQGFSAKSGDQIAAGATVANVAAKGNLRAHLGIDPAMARHVHPGQSLELETVSGDAHATVRVTGVDTQVDAITRLAAVYATIPQGFRVGPGETLRGSLALSLQASGLVIPYAALLDDGGRSYVFLVKNGVAHDRNVSLGSSSGDHIQILTGLSAGDRVVTEGATALDDGMKVTEQKVAR